MPTVGDLAAASLTVEPYSGSTTVALAVTDPNGVVTLPLVTSSDGGRTWTGAVTYSAAGVWRLVWTVSGTGARTAHELVSVAPLPGVTETGRTYATTGELATYLGEAPALDAARLLLRASQLLDADFLIPAVYDVDDETGMPTDPVVLAGFRDAVCAQVEFWNEVGEETDISGPLQGAQIGSVNLQFGAGDNRTSPSYYAPKLIRALSTIPVDKIRFLALGYC
jgi:hypothetical protein